MKPVVKDFDYHPTSDERHLADQLVTLARSRWKGLTQDAVAEALMASRIETAKAILREVKHLTRMDFGGVRWLDDRSVTDAIYRASRDESERW